jgi:hypothetical protein
MIIDIHFPSRKLHLLSLKDAWETEIPFTAKRIIPQLWRYQKLELKTLIDDSNRKDLRISTSAARWFLRDLVKNSTFIFSTLRSTYRLSFEIHEHNCLPVQISTNRDSDEVWVSRNAVRYGIVPTNLDESLEYDRLRNPKRFDLLVLFAESGENTFSYDVFETTHFSLLTSNVFQPGSYFTDYDIFEHARVKHGKLAIQKDKVIQISNRRFELVRRSPGWIESIGDKFKVFRPHKNIAALDQAIFFGSNLNWFHFIVECLTRFIAIPYDLVKGTPVILESGTHKNIRQICELLTSVPPIVLKPGEEVSVKKLIVGRESGVVDTIDTVMRRSQLLAIRKRILDSQQPTEQAPNRRIYLRRSPRLFRPLQNEKRIVSLLSKHGFISVYPEKESIGSLIKLLSETELVVVESGAAITNLMFAPKNLKVLELNPGDGGFGFWGRFLGLFEIQGVGIVGKRRVIGAKGLAVDGYRIPIKKIKRQLSEMLGKNNY